MNQSQSVTSFNHFRHVLITFFIFAYKRQNSNVILVRHRFRKDIAFRKYVANLQENTHAKV